MANGYLKVIAMGTLGADAETRFGQSGKAVCSWRMACTTGYFDKGTQAWKETVEWVSCVMFGKRAESVGQHLTKGKTVFVEGTLRTDSYDDKDGIKRYRTQVVVNEMIFAGGGKSEERSEPRGGGTGGYGGSTQRQKPPPAAQPGDDFGYGDKDDGIPFVSPNASRRERWGL